MGDAGCIFCGRSPQTKTHVFRKAWIARLTLPAAGPYQMVHESSYITGAAREGAWPVKEFDIAPGAACDSCNSGWMDRVDRAAEQIVEPMVLGRKATIRRYSDQKAVARWVSQVTILCDQAQVQQVIPPEIPRRFYKDGEPLPGLVVWLARTVPGWCVEAWERAWIVSRGTPPKASDRPNMCLVTFRVVQLVVQALIPLTEISWSVERGSNVQYLRKAWPSTYTPVSWPPDAALGPGAMVEFVKSFEPPGAEPGDAWVQRFG